MCFSILLLISPRLSISGAILGFIYTAYFIPQAPLALTGQGVFIPEKITPIRSLTYKGFLVSGQVHSFQTDNKTYHFLPCALFTKYEDDTLFSPFHFTGSLEKKKDSYQINYNVKKPLPITNFSHFRHKWKTSLHNFLEKKIKDRSSSHFLSALITGYLTDLYLKFSFFKLGLSHILAISGFHFSLLIGLASFFLTPLPLRLKSSLLILLAFTYFFLMGHSPSITRAFVMIILYYFAKIFDQESCPINNLGSALFIVLLLDPRAAFSLSFQLSFLSCCGIFLYYPLLAEKIPNKQGFFARLYPYYMHALSLCLAVNLMIFPLLLHVFNKISLLGMIYNLFFPLQVLACFALLLITLLIYPLIPPLSNLLFKILDPLTTISLIPVLNPPIYFDYYIRGTLSQQWAIVWTVCALFIGVYLKACHEKKGLEKRVNYI